MDKLRIYLVDDHKLFREGLKLLLSTQDFVRHIYEASNGREFIENLSFVDCDVVLMDIEMPEMNGIELGAALRMRDDTGFLIYLTTSPDFALDSYRVDAFDYLLKPVESELFFQSLDKAYRSFSQIMQKTVAIKTTDSIRMIPITDIRYAERIDKHIDYHLADNTVIHSTSFNGSFQNAVTELLSHKRMLLVGSSFVVNLFHVTEVTRSDLLLTGDLRVPVPRRMYETVKKEWADFWLNGGRYYAF